MTRIDVAPGFALNLECAGSGPALVLLHGFTGSAHSWGTFADSLARLFTVVAVDIVGHGLSDAPPTLDHYRMPQAVDDIVAAVNGAGFRRAHWLGYSMGGRTALHIAAAHPGAVDRLVLVGASPGIASPDERAARRDADEQLAARIERDGIRPFVNYWESIPLFASQSRLSPATREAIRAGRLACNATGLANSLRGMGAGAQEPLHEVLSSIRAPALLLAGADDEKYTIIGREMAGAMPHACFVSIPGAGHAAHLEVSAACARAVVTFLQQEEVD